MSAEVQVLNIDVVGEMLQLLPNGGVFWPNESILFIADLHLGKANHFRKSGIPVPLKVQESNLEKLDDVIRRTSCRSVFFLGDLFHSSWNKSWQAFQYILRDHEDVSFHLVLGNHDILQGDHYDGAGLSVHPEGLVLGPFQLNHHPIDNSELFSLCGHLHPAVRLRGKGRQGVKLPCFWKQPDQMILPAFGGFTGHATIRPKDGDEVFVIAGPVVRAVS